MNKEVSFKIAKLLKEKGFDETTKSFYLKQIKKKFIMNKRWIGIKEHFKNGGKLVWNDPKPIKDNDYQVSFLEDIPDEEEINNYTPILIQYNNGDSEAQVFLHELMIIK